MSETSQVLLGDGVRHAAPEGEIGGDGWTIHWRTLRGGLTEGVVVVTLSHDAFSVDVCPTRGMGVLAADCRGVPVGWSSPVPGPVHPQFVNPSGRNGLGWLDGFSELLCRCGLASNGPPGSDDAAHSPIESQLTLHGRIANIPADAVVAGFDDSNRRLWVRGACTESTMFGPRLVLNSTLSLRLGATAFDIWDEVTNLSARDTEFQLLYHINVGPPFLEAGSRFLTAFGEMCPRDERAASDVETYDTYLGPTSGYAEQVYFFDVLADSQGETQALLHNASASLGLSVRYDARQLPCLTQWKCTQPHADGYVAGIEPGTNFPNFKAFERQQGRVVTLGSGASYCSGLSVAVHVGADSVSGVAETLRSRQSGSVPTVRPSPTQPLAP